MEIDIRAAEGHLCAGELALRTGRYADAVSSFRGALDREPMSDEAVLGLGRAYELIGDRPSAERIYRSTVERRPFYWGAQFRLGNHYRERADYEQAVSAYERAASLNPGNAVLLARLGGIYTYLGRYDEALETFRTSTAIAPTFTALVNWGMTLYRMRQFERSVEVLTRACELRDSHQCIGNLARAYRAFKRPGEAHVLLQRAIALAARELETNPRNSDARLSLAEYHSRLGHRAEALDHLAQVQVGGDPHLMFYAALVHLHVGDRATAIEWLRKAQAASLPRAELQAWTDLDPLRQDPAFKSLLSSRRGA
jgi:tetratricopeptide (TPR) repeat protein